MYVATMKIEQNATRKLKKKFLTALLNRIFQLR
jgi:hypothetical protein